MAFAFAFVPFCLIVFVISYVYEKSQTYAPFAPAKFYLVASRNSKPACRLLAARSFNSPPAVKLLNFTAPRVATQKFKTISCRGLKFPLATTVQGPSRSRCLNPMRQKPPAQGPTRRRIYFALRSQDREPVCATASLAPTCREFLISPLLRACRVRHTAAQSRFCNETVFLARRLDKTSLAR